MKRLISFFLALFLADPSLGVSRSLLWAAETAVLEKIEVKPDQVNLSLTQEPKYNAFVTMNPPRLVVELLNTEFNAPQKELQGKGEWLKYVRSGQYTSAPQKISRIVLDLADLTAYEVKSRDGGLSIMIGNVSLPLQEESAAEALPGFQEPPSPAVTPAETPAETLEAKVTPAPEPEIPTEPAPAMEAAPEPAPAPAAKETPPASAAPKRASIGTVSLPRDRISLDFESTDVKDVLKLLSAKSGLNIIYGPDVAGTVSIHLKDVPFDEAFRAILDMKSLAYQQMGTNILRVATPSILKTARQEAIVNTKIFTLNYSKAASIQAHIESIRSAAGRKGSTLADAVTNILIVTDSPEGLDEATRLISQLDRKPQQVLIEAKLVEISLDKSFDIGVSWDFKQTGQMGNAATMIGQTANPLAGGANLGGGPLATKGSPGLTGVDAKSALSVGAFTFGRVTNSSYFTATLAAGIKDGRVKVLSDPRVATLNNQTANIQINSQTPYATTEVTAQGASSQKIQYVVIGINLTVTPTVNADGYVTMKLSPTVSQPGLGASVAGAPPVNSRSADTIVLIKDGETVAIGGLVSDNLTDEITKVPVLGDIPVLGWLFKSKHLKRTRQELVIFVTPHIMD